MESRQLYSFNLANKVCVEFNQHPVNWTAGECFSGKFSQLLFLCKMPFSVL